MKLRALFVDDEQMVISGLRRMLRSLRSDWDMAFVTSGQEALDLLETDDYAVIVSDMRMPVMDGASLLNEVANRHPSIARIVLSGHAELDAILRAVRPAHRYFAKPCEPGQLEAALSQVGALRRSDGSDALCRTLGAHRRLPSPQAAINRLRSALSADTVDTEIVADIVTGDIAMISADK